MTTRYYDKALKALLQLREMPPQRGSVRGPANTQEVLTMADITAMQGKTKLLYLMDQIDLGRNPFEAIREWDEAHPLPEDIYPSEAECWAVLNRLQDRGSLTPSELITLQFAVDELMSKVNSSA